MANLIINANIAVWALQQITRGKETHIYKKRWDRPFDTAGGCYYVHNYKPDCGVAHALDVLGVSIQALTEMDKAGDSGIIAVAVPGAYLTDYARSVFAAFQMAQDRGYEWGEALYCAQRACANPGLPTKAYVF